MDNAKELPQGQLLSKLWLSSAQLQTSVLALQQSDSRWPLHAAGGGHLLFTNFCKACRALANIPLGNCSLPLLAQSDFYWLERWPRKSLQSLWEILRISSIHMEDWSSFLKCCHIWLPFPSMFPVTGRTSRGCHLLFCMNLVLGCWMWGSVGGCFHILSDPEPCRLLSLLLPLFKRPLFLNTSYAVYRSFARPLAVLSPAKSTLLRFLFKVPARSAKSTPTCPPSV